MRLLHVTAHLGGGVGKVLSRLVEASSRRADGIEHTIACLAMPEKTLFVDHARAHGARVVCAPDARSLDTLVREADVVQLEWWHHPLVARWMGATAHPPMRLVVWSHVSGLGLPTFPSRFLTLPHRFLFSSTCSLDAPAVRQLSDEARARLGVVFSSGGFDDLPEAPRRGDDTPLRTGYVGTLNFAKLHPDLMDFVAAVRIPDFRLALVGDPTTADALHTEARARGLTSRLDVRGFTHDIAGTLSHFDVLAYLLNPQHYGTAENALLEAMAMGVVPVVLDNPAERQLVEHERTGLIVRTPSEFADAMDRLATTPGLRATLSAQAAAYVRKRFDIAVTANALHAHYAAVLDEDKRSIDFRSVFGTTPAQWFMACQHPDTWTPDALGRAGTGSAHAQLEATKGSVFHYRDHFPEDAQLAGWARQAEHAR
ncbi:glycosyltransferase family 4 protein [Nitrogeniibacter aestuarii]|uniref:glycosyltransferase family 4 protein n=1 Tax=Nitrogeniibacter aestuarii TaxID=2815343 RepID=UPI001D0F972A|nr:glycosyltransferase family 4 protein [Nitrogeniibacter aestuarii]